MKMRDLVAMATIFAAMFQKDAAVQPAPRWNPLHRHSRRPPHGNPRRYQRGGIHPYYGRWRGKVKPAYVPPIPAGWRFEHGRLVPRS